MSVTERTFVVTREYLISLLRAWQQDKITTAEFYETIEIIFGHYTKLLDWENEEEDSITRDVIANLEMLDLDFIIQEDIEPIIELLNTPIGKFEEGMKKWEQYKPKTNIEERIKKFNGQYPYIQV